MPADTTDIWAIREKFPDEMIKTAEEQRDKDKPRKMMVVKMNCRHCWPDMLVIVEQQGGGHRTAGYFAEDGRLLRLTIEVADEDAEDSEVTSAQMREPVLGTLRAWHRVGREVARKILAGEPYESIVIDGRDATEALRIQMQADRQPLAPQRWRGARREARIRAVASSYRQLVAGGEKHPRGVLAEAFGLSEDHVGKLLVAARRERNGQPPLLGPALRGKAGESGPPAVPDA